MPSGMTRDEEIRAIAMDGTVRADVRLLVGELARELAAMTEQTRTSAREIELRQRAERAERDLENCRIWLRNERARYNEATRSGKEWFDDFNKEVAEHKKTKGELAALTERIERQNLIGCAREISGFSR